jgi:hypothetical protein
VIVRPSYTIDYLRRMANARNRDVDTDLRVISIDDEDAQRLVAYIEQLEGSMYPEPRP